MAILADKANISKVYPELDSFMEQFDLYKERHVEINVKVRASSDIAHRVVFGNLIVSVNDVECKPDADGVYNFGKWVESRFKDLGKEFSSVTICIDKTQPLVFSVTGYTL